MQTNIGNSFTVSSAISWLTFFISLSFSGDGQTTDWDKAWSSFRKKGKKGLFSQFNPNKYVSWNPRRSEYPLSEEPNPIKRTERSNLMLWTSPRFTLAGAIVVVTLLLIYTLLAPTKWLYPKSVWLLSIAILTVHVILIASCEIFTTPRYLACRSHNLG